MSAKLVEHLAFDETAGPVAVGPDADAERAALRPAVYAGYANLSNLRYDYPLVLSRSDVGEATVQSLSHIVDSVLQQIAPRGMQGERLRQHVLRLEKELRTLISSGEKGLLSELWQRAEQDLLARTGDEARSALLDSSTRARAALAADGEIIDCDERTPVALLNHLWSTIQAGKAKRMVSRIDKLVLGLANLLKADFMKTDQGRTSSRLKRSFGSGFGEAFDFEAMSRLLGTSSQGSTLPAKRRKRIEAVLSVLKSQRFFAPLSSRAETSDRAEPYSFVFESCASALDAFRHRLPEIATLVGAVHIAELELEHRYRDSMHDAYFARFDEESLTGEELSWFPPYLICVREGDRDAADRVTLLEILSSGLPMKILVQSDDILEDLPVTGGKLSFGTGGTRLAAMAVGLNSAYVLQSSSSHLYQMKDRILGGLNYDGTTLFSVYSGCSASIPDIPPYLRAAAAMEARAFPAFTYDPSAGSDLASRFRIDDNPQCDADWPVYRLDYEDEDHQRITEQLGFTFADFVAGDSRHAERFERVPRGRWHDGMVPVAELSGRAGGADTEKIPYVPMVDGHNMLQRLAIDDELMAAVRRCADMWRSLQELGGINNSHARRLLSTERKLWERQNEEQLRALDAGPTQEARSRDAVQEADLQDEASEEVMEESVGAPTDEPYIETPRCTTCDECTQINNRMFAYDANKQAYIADPDAGTFRELVEAAESCQVCIIHPGRPRNPDEPGLDELIKRAEPFL